jgi:hypothetical protein
MEKIGLRVKAGSVFLAAAMLAARALFLSLPVVLAMAHWAVAQSEVAPEAAKALPSAIPPVAASTEVGPAWASLSADQKVALAPLEAAWPGLSESHKSKWIALVQKFPEMAEADRSRLHARMVDWAALSPKDRELARLNFAQTKKLSSDERVANWEAYQALPDSKKQELLKAAPKKPVGVAVTVKPVPANKLAQVPVTRKTPESLRVTSGQRNMVDRYTLLPQSAGSKNGVPAPDPSVK